MCRSIRNVLIMSLFPLFKKFLIKLAAPTDDKLAKARQLNKTDGSVFCADY